VLYGEDGKVTRFSGQWIFGWVLDGHVLQDVLIESRGQERRSMGSTIRFYDAKSEQWRVVWIPPSSGNVIALKGGVVGDRIVLEGLDVDGAKLRWSFNDIHADSFLQPSKKSSAWKSFLSLIFLDALCERYSTPSRTSPPTSL
jgi:hypothetical protein